MSIQYSPDHQYWWDGRQWQPVAALPPGYGAMGPPEPYSTPGTLKGAMWIAIGGAALLAIVGLLMLVLSGVIASNPDMRLAIEQQMNSRGTTSSLSAQTLILILGGAVLVFGLLWTGVNALLFYCMSRRQSWAWWVVLALVALGSLFDLFQAISNPRSLLHLAVINAPIFVLLLLTPTRRWVRV